ncbi:uncharacterized protein C15orf39 homolog [Callorhinchus milii]|uniref:uncharacterized protein C15orf39 homolog n=1 Tax=Callorhinchus milii TaxID=7868 RepID=UPI001C3FEAD6|nr:uncharacterized protein C15orf39 homolog [Callorhinchus milii]
MAGDNHRVRQLQYSHLPPPVDNTSEPAPRQVSSAGRKHKEARGMPPAMAPGYGAFNGNLLQGPRYSALSYDSVDGSSHINAPVHSLQELQKISMQPYSLADCPRVPPPLYHSTSSPPKFPGPVQLKVVQGSSQPTGGHYSLQPQSYRLPVEYPASSGQVAMPTALFTNRHNPGSFPLFPDNVRYLPPHYHVLPPESPGPPPTATTVPLIPPAYQPPDLARQASTRAKGSRAPSQRDDCAHTPPNAPSGNVLRFRPRVIIDAQKVQRCRRSPPDLVPDEDQAGHCQLLSKHSAFHPVVSGSHVKGAGEKSALPPAPRPLQEPAVHDPSVSACLLPPSLDYDPSPLEKSKPPASPPMPVINNVFSLAPYQAYLEASGIFTKHLKCQLHQECTCAKEGKIPGCGEGVEDLHCERRSSPASNGPASKMATGYPFEGGREPLDGTGGRGQSEAGDSAGPARARSEFQPRALNFSLKPSGRLQNEGPPPGGECPPLPLMPGSSCECPHARLAAENGTEPDTALDLSVRSKLRFVNAAWQSPAPSSCFSSSASSPSPGAKQESACPQPAAPAELPEVVTELASQGERPGSREPLPAEPGEKNAGEASDEATKSQTGHVNLKKYKTLRPAPAPPAPPAEKVPGPIKFHSVDLLVPLSLKLRPLKLLLPDLPKSMLSRKPEPATPPSESKVLVPDNGESVHSDPQAYFMRLHQSLCSMVAQSVTDTSKDVLRLCLRDVEAEESQGTENPRLRSSPKSKNGTKNYGLLKMSKSKEIWLHHEPVQSALQKLLAHLETYLFTRRCPFPHVIRAGAIFIPIYLIKEKLFSKLDGTMIDQVFQEHKIELRPTTLSEEKKLQSELQLQRCSSRLIKLLSLKQLPDIYPDLLNVLWHSCLKVHLGDDIDEDLKDTDPPQAPADPSNSDDVGNNQPSDPPPGEFGAKPQSVSDVPSCTQEKQDVSVTGSRLRVKGTKRRWKLAIPCSVNSKMPRVACCPQSAHEVKERSESPSGVRSNGGSTPEVKAEEAETPQPSYRKLRKRKILLMAKASATPNCEKNSSSLALTKPVTPNGGEREAKDSSPVRVTKVCRVLNRNNAKADSLRPTRSTSKVLHLRSSIVRLKFQRPHRLSACRPTTLKPPVTGKTASTCRKYPKALAKHREMEYPNLVGKRIRHLYEESDKSESWYKGLVVRLHEKHPNPLKTVYEVKYDSEPEWQYYLELLHDYAKGWVRVEV